MKLLKILLLILLLAVLLPIAVFAFILANSSSQKDRTYDPRLTTLLGKCFQLRQDAYIYQDVFLDDYILDFPSDGGSCSISIDEYKKNEKPVCELANQGNFIQKVPKGNRVYLDKVTRSGDLIENGYHYLVFGRVESSQELINLKSILHSSSNPEKASVPIIPIPQLIQACAE